MTRLRPGVARARRATLTAIAAAMLAAAIVGAPSPAAAHAVLISSDPVDGSELARSPAAVTLTFSEPVQLIEGTAQVLSRTGERVDAEGARTSGTTLTIPLEPDLARGSYTVTWRALSVDAHLVSGSIAFGVRQAATAVGTSTTPTPATGPLDLVAQAAVGVGYVGVILLFGVRASAGLLWPGALGRRRTRVAMRVGWGALVAAAAVQLLLEGPRSLDSGWRGVAGLDGFVQTLASPVGIALVARIGLLALVPAAALLPARARQGTVLALGAGVVFTIAMTGHAAAGADAPLAIAAAVLHVASMALWLGGLLVLFAVVLPGIRTDDDLAAARLPRWSLVAFTAVVALVVSGEYQAWRQVQPPAALWSTAYGLTLVVKVALVLVVLTAALAGQRVIARRRAGARGAGGAGEGADPADAAATGRRLRRSVAVELVAVTLVVAVTTVLTALPPASATYGPPLVTMAPVGGGATLSAELASTRHGPLALAVSAADGAGIVPIDEVSATLSSDEHGIAAIAVPLERDGDVWRSIGAAVPLAGAWTIAFRVVTGAGAVTTSVDVTFW